MLTRRDGRLKAYDRVDPYIALHECPSPSYVGDLVHLRWEGLIHPGFVQVILDTGMWVLFWTLNDSPCELEHDFPQGISQGVAAQCGQLAKTFHRHRIARNFRITGILYFANPVRESCALAKSNCGRYVVLACDPRL